MNIEQIEEYSNKIAADKNLPEWLKRYYLSVWDEQSQALTPKSETSSTTSQTA